MRKLTLCNAKRVVLKVGSSLLAGKQGGLNRAFIGHLADQIAAERERGREIILVSSGAIATGRHKMSVEKSPSEDMPTKQALAAIGQPQLMQTYITIFGKRGLVPAQVLITRDAFQDRERFTNAQNTIDRLLRMGVVPVINENDTVATEEIRFGENDVLAAYMTLLAGADALIMLTDVEGFYDAPPEEGGSLVSFVERVTAEHAAAAGESKSGVGSGGMASKLLAAKMVSAAGSVAVIARGRNRGAIKKILDGEEVGTFFMPSKERLKGKRRWLAFAGKVAGEIKVDEGAKKAIVEGKKSLLPKGINGVEGHFAAGEIVDITCAGVLVARGASELDSEELRRVMGHHSDEAMKILNRPVEPEAVHRDNLVVLEGIW
jgi:glutamate 5-kinase